MGPHESPHEKVRSAAQAKDNLEGVVTQGSIRINRPAGPVYIKGQGLICTKSHT